MARNRKNQNSGVLFWPAVKASLICLVIVVCCVGYVWQKKVISDLSQEIRNDEKLRDAMHQNNQKLERQLAGLMSPTSLEAPARKLGLVPAQQSQIWRLSENIDTQPVLPVSQPVATVAQQH